MSDDNKIANINRVYFRPFQATPEDNCRDYLLDNLQDSVLCFIRRDVLVHCLEENERNGKDQEAARDARRQFMAAMSDGDAECRREIGQLCSDIRIAIVVKLRQTIKYERKRGVKLTKETIPGSQTGGNFLKDISSITSAELEEFLSGQLSKDESQKTHADLKELQSLVDDFNRCEYVEKIIGAGEKTLLHKDWQPEKRNIVQNTEQQYDGIRYRSTSYEDAYKIDCSEIAACLNDFAEIVKKYVALAGICPTPPRVSSYSIEEYLRRCMKAYSLQDDDNKIYNATISALREKMPACIGLLGL